MTALLRLLVVPLVLVGAAVSSARAADEPNLIFRRSTVFI